MTQEYFDRPLRYKEGVGTDVDISKKPFFYNEGGRPTFVEALPPGVTPLVPAATDPALALGRAYVVSGADEKPDLPYGVITQLGFMAAEVTYEPMWATRAAAAAFGITLVESGQGVRVSSPVETLSQTDYEYGAFDGHWSPYQNTGSRLLTVICTDLEHHNSPHVFASVDPHLPLVISVGRYWPDKKTIRLADLWVPRGSALYIPPKPNVRCPECIDLHNNRNSARACWGAIGQDSVATTTLLQSKDNFFFWFWNALPTIHANLSPKV